MKDGHLSQLNFLGMVVGQQSSPDDETAIFQIAFYDIKDISHLFLNYSVCISAKLNQCQRRFA